MSWTNKGNTCMLESVWENVCAFQCLRAEDMNHFWHQRLPGETVLLSSTAERVHLHALDISTCLDGIRVWHQVGQSWERRRKGQSKFKKKCKKIIWLWHLNSDSLFILKTIHWNRAAVCVCWQDSKYFTFLSCQPGSKSLKEHLLPPCYSVFSLSVSETWGWICNIHKNR